ncbi:hypothetical protein V5F49_02515 [Xanthobacter sp. V3C-3]|uniref:hypothetical protein n=1 Tax=Xanthobacter lutulentifluminis TaxID=3119935 RepID=UPI003726D3D2
MPSSRTLAIATLALALSAAAARAESRIFIIENSDGSGVDACLASGAPCGRQAADAWCRSHDYEHAIDFGRVAQPGSGFTPASAAPAPACTGPLCPETVTITCSR